MGDIRIVNFNVYFYFKKLLVSKLEVIDLCDDLDVNLF